ncbi:unnamed protein product [Darwinula stevensoni]|uniref:CARD domain-containing protein n=1 Tax=Darwinula stevensoni TaxID=69355 RepID=A0A7R9FNB7_9CRUS|nr:unnamed protein product [Darwinula stevensoni]CAG0896618.1 unnamed protein product [Darwinula stevensoni]
MNGQLSSMDTHFLTKRSSISISASTVAKYLLDLANSNESLPDIQYKGDASTEGMDDEHERDMHTVADTLNCYSRDLQFIAVESVLRDLRAQRIIEHDEYFINFKKSKKEKLMFLLETLPLRGYTAFRGFIEALHRHYSFDLAKKLEQEYKNRLKHEDDEPPHESNSSGTSATNEMISAPENVPTNDTGSISTS